MSTIKRALIGCLALIFVGLAGSHIVFKPAAGAELSYRSLQISNNGASATSIYGITFQLNTAHTLGSIAVQFCSNDPLPGSSCTAPSGFDIHNASLQSQAGPTGFSVSSVSTANRLVLSRLPAVSPPEQARYEIGNVTNPSAPGSYYARIQTYSSNDGTGTSNDFGGIAFAIANTISITAEVPPYLIFCTGITITGLNCANAQGDQIDFGELSSNRTKSGTSQLLVATNAEDGYNVSVQGTTLTSGNNIIDNISGGDVSRPGTAQFGFNLHSNASPSIGTNPTGPGVANPTANYFQPNSYRFFNGDAIIMSPVPDDVRQYTASYIANVPPKQPAGVYVSTLTYICLANF